MMPDINEMLPFLVPLAIVEVVLLIYTLHHILTHQTYRHGSRALWIVITLIGMQFIGPILYFLHYLSVVLTGNSCRMGGKLCLSSII